MNFSLSLMIVTLASSVGFAALPPQFSECLRSDALPSISYNDLKELAKVAKVTYCQNQVNLIGRNEAKDLLRSNVDLGVSLARSNYSYEDLLDMARAGSYVLYVDTAKLSRAELINLAREGVQLVIMSISSTLSQVDLVAIANEKSFIYNVTSMVPRADLQQLVSLNVQVVIRSAQSNLSKEDIVAVAQTNSSLVTVFP
ncbi:hypothetical protein D3C87_109810 [compost metagenome]